MVLREGLDPSTLRWQNFIVAQDEAGVIVGLAQIKPYKDCREFGSLVVQTEYRRQGVGAMLIEHALADEAGDVYLLCEVHRVPYYSKFGFVAIAHDAAPGTLRRKLWFARLLGLFGIRIACMKSAAPRQNTSAAS